MELKDMSIEDLEIMSYTDLTYMLIKENKKSMNTPTIFKEICNLLGYSDDEYAAKIGDYYTSLTIDKRFVLLDNNEWDIRDHHSIEIEVDEEDEDEEENIDEEEEIADSEEENIDEVIEDDDLDTNDDIEDEIEDLSIVSDEELEEE